MTASSDEVPHLSCNEDAVTTILMIPGAFSSPEVDWSGIIPLLPKYHLILPCLSYLPLTLDELSGRLAVLIRSQAKDGRAHIYGFSMGSQVALALAENHPHVCRSLMLSGYQRFNLEEHVKRLALPHLLRLNGLLGSTVPTSVRDWALSKPADKVHPHQPGLERLRADEQLAAECPTLVRAKELVSMLSASDRSPHRGVVEIDRVLAIAADKGNVFWPSNDPIDQLQALGQAMRAARVQKDLPVDVTLLKGRTLRHPWHIGNPQLCADTINAFLDQRDLPATFDVVPFPDE